MELKELESKIQALLKNENIKIEIDKQSNVLLLYFNKYKTPYFTINLANFEKRIWHKDRYSKKKLFPPLEILIAVVDSIDIQFLIIDLENELKALIKEYIQ